MRLAGRVAVVTGAARGIGAAVARRLAAEGARVIGADVAPVAIEGVEAARCDVTDEAAVEALAERARALGSLDVWVNNAGVIAVGEVAETTLADWRRVQAATLDGTFLGCRAAARAMRAQVAAGGRPGAIVNVNSGAGRRGVPGLAAYCAAKGAGLRLTEALAQELGPLGIRVNAVTPGHVATAFWEEIAAGVARLQGGTPEAAVEGFRATVPMGRFGTPEEIAAAVAWLCSDEAGYVSGAALGINGAEFPG